MARRRNRVKAVKFDPFARPTAERMAHNDTEHAGAAVRIVPVIDTMLRANQLSRREYDALAYYREQAHRAEDDCAQSGTLAPERIMGGGGQPGGSRIPASLLFTPAIAETARIERDLGGLLDIARAVAVEDMTLTRWCIAKHGGRERLDGAGRFVAMVPVREKETVGLARIELRNAAGRIST